MSDFPVRPQVDALAVHRLESDGQLVDWMLAHNERLSKRSDKEWLAERPGAAGKTGEVAFKKALQKARGRAERASAQRAHA